jgi:dolichol-phosphate mannosyltransferase
MVESRLDVSLVMPAFNEEDNIKEAVKKARSVVSGLGVRYEVIVVDDGSFDDTLTEAVNYSNNDSHVRILSYRKNMGKGFAVKTGFCHASGDVVIFIDSDLDIHPNQISKYLGALKSADMVIASKRHPQSKVETPLVRRLLSQSFNVLARLLTGVKVSDTQTGLKAIRRTAFETVFSRLAVKRYAYDVELLTVAGLNGIKIAELPINVQMRSMFKFKEAWRMLIDLLGIAYRLRVSKFYS